MRLLPAERQALTHQVGHSHPQRGIEPLDMLRTTNDVQAAEYYGLVGAQAICMATGVQVWSGQALPQAKGADLVPCTHEATHDAAGVAVHGEPDPQRSGVAGHKGA